MEASTSSPWYLGLWVNSSCTCVGRLHVKWSKADQSRSWCFMSSDKKTVFLFVLFALVMNISIGPNNGLPMDKAIETNWSIPCNFRRQVMETHLSCLTALNSTRMLLHLLVGSSMVNAMPSSNQPRISFQISHIPSVIRFFTLIGVPFCCL